MTIDITFNRSNTNNGNRLIKAMGGIPVEVRDSIAGFVSKAAATDVKYDPEKDIYTVSIGLDDDFVTDATEDLVNVVDLVKGMAAKAKLFKVRKFIEARFRTAKWLISYEEREAMRWFRQNQEDEVLMVCRYVRDDGNRNLTRVEDGSTTFGHLTVDRILDINSRLPKGTDAKFFIRMKSGAGKIDLADALRLVGTYQAGKWDKYEAKQAEVKEDCCDDQKIKQQINNKVNNFVKPCDCSNSPCIPVDEDAAKQTDDSEACTQCHGSCDGEKRDCKTCGGIEVTENDILRAEIELRVDEITKEIVALKAKKEKDSKEIHDRIVRLIAERDVLNRKLLNI